MKIALLSGASPKTCKEGAIVRLLPGTWRFRLQGLKDSVLALKVEGYEAWNGLQNDTQVTFEEPTAVQVRFDVRGSEDYITAFAEKL